MKKLKVNDFTESATIQCDVDICQYKGNLPRCYLDIYIQCKHYTIAKHFTRDDLQVNNTDISD